MTETTQTWHTSCNKLSRLKAYFQFIKYYLKEKKVAFTANRRKAITFCQLSFIFLEFQLGF